MSNENLYIVSYDICDPRRWRKVYKIMQGYGEWLQLSIFQCRLSRTQLLQLRALLEDEIKHGEDHVLLLDMGPATRVEPRVLSLGQPYSPMDKGPIVV